MLWKQSFTIASLLTMLVVCSIITQTHAMEIAPPKDYVLEKSAETLSQKAIDYLSQNAEDGRCKIWVFFTDKGIKSDAELAQTAQSMSNRITDRAMWRRSKVGKDKFTIVDVPVHSQYIDAIIADGAKLRRTSRYLNAASFEVELGRLTSIADLPFVREIRPMLAGGKRYEIKVGSVLPDEESQPETKSIAYGESYGQVSQINVPIAHASGYRGEGVIISVFDSGFRTDHRAFSNIDISGRLIAKWDFVFDDKYVENDGWDWPTAWDHGTGTWSMVGGEWANHLYGTAYRASFILAKTEDIRSEKPVEEDNWVAAMEWADSIGTDIITASLSYYDWYDYSDFDGNTATTTIAADMAAEYGIVCVNSNGNEGPSSGTMGAPADADTILAVGAVSSSGAIAGFSSRGPTYDGRIKPEVCAQGVGSYCAGTGDQYELTTMSGTSASCPILAGVAALVLQAHPNYTPAQVREAILMTADRADSPNNSYGWGIADCWAAINYCIEDQEYMAGDPNGTGDVDIDDVVFLVGYIFAGGKQPCPTLSGDADGSGDVDVDDAVYLISFIFSGGPPPVAS